MSVKKSQQANLSRNNTRCFDIIRQINIVTTSIKSGCATQKDISVCKRLTNKLNRLLTSITDIDEFYRWLANETIEMASYTCNQYARSHIDDKI